MEVEPASASGGTPGACPDDGGQKLFKACERGIDWTRVRYVRPSFS
jgi:hypothetical protein